MAPKRLSPLDEPPAASSTEEEASSSEGEGEEEEEEAEAGSGSGSGSEDEEDDEAEPEDPKTSALPSNHAADKKPQPHSKKDKPDSSSTESESGSDSDTELDNTRRSAGAADSNVKPIASKPMEDTTASKKPRSKSNATPAASSRKRSTASGKSEAKDTKRAKKNDPEPDDDEDRSVADEEQKKSGDEKKLFQRLWSEDDEIVILKGMIDYTSKKGADPSADMNAFHDFIKKSLEINFTKAQLADKVRRLKKKYENNNKKGNKYNPTKANEVKAFELSKKIWGGRGSSGVGGGEEAKPNGKLKSNPKSNKSLASLKSQLLSSPEHSKEAEKMEVDWNPGVSDTLREVVEFSKSLGVVGLPEQVVKKGLDLLSRSKKAEMEENWKKLHLAELELYAKRTELISVQAKLIWEAYNKSSDH